MRVLTVDPAAPERGAIEEAARALRAGRLVAFPTETVYGLGANALDEDAVARIFEAKERPAHNPLIVHVADRDAARAVVERWPPTADRLADAFWPGPLTVVLRKRAAVPDTVTAGLDTVAVRVPSHPVALALLRAARQPVAAPSANPFTGVSPTTAEHVRAGLGDRIDVVLDAGPTPVGIESTVVDLTREPPALLRPGMISREALEDIVGPVAPAGAEEAEAWPETAPAERPRRREAPPAEAREVRGRGAPGARPAPGMLRRHYSPRADVRLFGRGDVAQAEALARDAGRRDERVGALLLEQTLDAPVEHVVRMPAEPDAYARRLYAALHELDDVGCDLILVEAVPAAAAWAGIRDRLIRAAG